MKRLITIIMSAVFLLAIVAACSEGERPLTVDELLSLGEQFLLDGNYAQALVQFRQAIEVEPMNPRGYTGAAEAYVGLGEYGRAREVLEDGQRVVGDDVGIRRMLDNINRAEEELLQAEIEAEVERRLAETEVEEEYGQSENDGSEEDSNVEIVPSVDLAQSYLDIIENIGVSMSQGDWVVDGIDSVSFIDLTNDGIPELAFTRMRQQWIDFYIYSYQNGRVYRLNYIEDFTLHGGALFFWNAYVTDDSKLILRGTIGSETSGGIGSRFFIFGDILQPAVLTELIQPIGGHTTLYEGFWRRTFTYFTVVTDTQFDSELSSIYSGATYRIIDSFAGEREPRNGATDISMTFDEAVEFLRGNPF